MKCFLSPYIVLFHKKYIYVCIQLLFKYISLLRKVAFVYCPYFGRSISFFSIKFIEYFGPDYHYI